MKKNIRYVGLDVHAETIAVAVAEAGGEVRSLGTIPNRLESVRRLVKKLGPPESLRVCYEAGPTGYVLYWQLTELGVACEVVAPSLVPTKRPTYVHEIALEAHDVAPVDEPEYGRDALRRRDEVRVRRVARDICGIEAAIARRPVVEAAGLNEGDVRPGGLPRRGSPGKREVPRKEIAREAGPVAFRRGDARGHVVLRPRHESERTASSGLGERLAGPLFLNGLLERVRERRRLVGDEGERNSRQETGDREPRDERDHHGLQNGADSAPHALVSPCAAVPRRRNGR